MMCCERIASVVGHATLLYMVAALPLTVVQFASRHRFVSGLRVYPTNCMLTS